MTTAPVSTALRSAAFVVGLVLVFGVAIGAGRLVGPLDTEPVAAHDEGGHEGTQGSGDATDHGDEGHGSETSSAVADVAALNARADGFTLDLADEVVAPGRTTLAFRVLTSSGRPLIDYTESHEKDLHLIVVRRDLTGFQHVHPRLDRSTGTWSTEVDLSPGVWRVIADFTPEGWGGVTLADDLSVPGGFRPAELPGDSRTDTVDGYTVTLTGDTAPGASTVLTTRVTRDGEPVTDLQPYLGAHGHLVALRAGDLGYLHVHPEEGPPGPEIDFATAFPTHGTYRLFLDFKHGGRVHTAQFTVVAGGVPGATTGAAAPTDAHEEDDHDH